MNRRHLIRTAAATATTLTAAASLAAAGSSTPAKSAGHAGHAGHAALMATPHGPLVASVTHCIVIGEACLTHCLQMLSAGEKAMAECAMSVQQTLAVCTALQKLALQGSAHTRRQAALAAEVCAECEKICRKFPDMPDCVACADACADCVQACRKTAA